MRIIVINKEIVFAYLGDEAFNIDTGYAVILRIIHKIDYIACPAAEIGGGSYARVIAGDIERTEHMTEFDLLTVRGLEPADTPEIAGGRAVQCVHFGDVFDECGILGAGKDSPAAGIVLIYACTDIVDDQSGGGLVCRRGIIRSIAFEDFKVRKKRIEFLGGRARGLGLDLRSAAHGFRGQARDGREHHHEGENEGNKLGTVIFNHDFLLF